MRLLFIDISQDVSLPHPQHILAPLEIGYCASLAKEAGHKTSFIDLRIQSLSHAEIIRRIRIDKPDVLLIKPASHSLKKSRAIADSAKPYVKLICFYGPYASLFPHNILSTKSRSEICVIGEIEAAIQNILKLILSAKKKNWKNCPGIAYQNRFGHIKCGTPIKVDEPDRLPYPRHEMFIEKPYSFYYPLKPRIGMKLGFIHSSRGCPNACRFCSILERASHGKVYRGRSPEDVVGEMAYLHALGVNTIYFIDDNMASDRDRLIRLCDLIVSMKLNRKIAWACQMRVDGIDNLLAHKMRKAGCSTVCLGIESGSDQILQTLGKGLTRKRIISSISILDKVGIWHVHFLIVGNPGETIEQAMMSKSLIRRLKPHMLQLHLFKSYPDASHGLNHTMAANSHSEIEGVNVSMISTAQLLNLRKDIYKSYYFSPSFIFGRFPSFALNIMLNIRLYLPLAKKALSYVFAQQTLKTTH